MSVMLKLYLEEVRQQLKTLPKKQREAELREVESHLHAMIEAAQAEGMLHGEAVSAAIRQFGCPHRVGGALSRVWRRHRLEPLWRAVAAALGALGCQGAFFLAYRWLMPLVTGAFYNGKPFSGLVEAFLVALYFSFLLTPVVCGSVSYRIVPRRGWWAALLACFWGIVMLSATFEVTPERFTALQVFMVFEFPLAALCGAWWSQRRDLRWKGHKADLSLTAG